MPVVRDEMNLIPISRQCTNLLQGTHEMTADVMEKWIEKADIDGKPLASSSQSTALTNC